MLSPDSNPNLECVMRSVKEECLERTVSFGERSLQVTAGDTHDPSRILGVCLELHAWSIYPWLLLDTARYRPQRLSELRRSFPLRPDDNAIAEPLGKLTLPPDLAFCFERVVTPGDLDVNNHVNNAEYVRWISDCLDTPQPVSLASLQVNYLDEAILGDTIALQTGTDPDGAWYCEGIQRAKGSRVFQARAEQGSSG